MRVAADNPVPLTVDNRPRRQVSVSAGRDGVLAYCGDVEAVSDRRPAAMPTAHAGEWE